MSRSKTLLMTVAGALLWFLVWGFAAGWAGELVLYPATDLGWTEWLISAVWFYAAPALTVFGGAKLILAKRGDVKYD